MVPLVLWRAAPGQVSAPSAVEVLSRAHALHLALQDKPAGERTAADYQRILKLLPPLWRDAKAASADDARFAYASLAVAMARDLHDEKAYAQAADVLRDLLRLSPYSAYRRNAVFALSQMEIFHLDQADKARANLKGFVHDYPADPRTAVAQLEIRGQKVAEPAYLLDPVPAASLPGAAPTPPAASAPAPAAPSAAAPDGDSPQGPASQSWTVNIGNIGQVQVYTTPRSSSVVIGLRRNLSFQRGELPKRHLVYFDISSRGGADPSGAKTLRVGDGRVVQIRVADNRPGITRVVIETAADAQADRGGLFPNPERLIVGVRGKATAAALHSPATPARPAAPLSDGGDSLTRALGLKIHRIVLDAGHGGHDTGTMGQGNLLEKDVVLDVALRLGKLLHERLGLAITYTRHDDTFIPLEERTAIANRAHADLFVSIHANSSPASSARGVETYYLNLTHDAQALAVAARENADGDQAIHDLPKLVRTIALNDKLAESRELAEDVQRGLARATGEADRGVKTAPFVVLIGAQMPSVLAEISFLSNRTDDQKLRQKAYRQRLAEGLYQGLRAYILSLSGQQAAELN
ncbi:MAG TPA: N-acetylmuramoyl-L-alanine amidase [Terriglobales bacterium]|nr:N-acetylmuramoyl-L-alanine amidase [Terriglobales bacterium]